MWTLFFAAFTLAHGDDIIEIRMPGVQIAHDDTYYHTSIPLSATLYVTGFKAEAHAGVVHHLLLYGCASVKEAKYWIGGAPCEQDPKILWAWALDAPEFVMPPNVSMEIGNARIKHLVMEIHYEVAQPADFRDTSGVDITFTTERTRYLAGIYLFMALDGAFQPGQPDVQVDLTCNYTSPQINVFAYRTHAHDHGFLISGWREKNGTWLELGSRDPRLPEEFVRMPSVAVVTPGDVLHARCDYNTTGSNHTLQIGNTHHDEMCNFYLMFYTDSEHIKNIEQGCVTSGKFTVPLNESTGYEWYERYHSSRTLVIVVTVLVVVLLCGPFLYCCRHHCGCLNRTAYYKRANDGFEKLFSPDDDEEEDEILYKSNKIHY